MKQILLKYVDVVNAVLFGFVGKLSFQSHNQGLYQNGLMFKRAG